MKWLYNSKEFHNIKYNPKTKTVSYDCHHVGWFPGRRLFSGFAPVEDFLNFLGDKA